MRDVRLKQTENEKFATNVVGLNTNADHFAMAENIEDIIQREKTNKFNEQVEAYIEKLNAQTKALNETVNKLSDFTFDKVEIRPLFGRVLIGLFDKNPFQKMTTSKSGLITDLGGMTPEHFNTDTGEMEEDELTIMVGVVQHTSPDTKYLKRGDIVFIDKHSLKPVPYYRQGYYCVGEQQIIAVVNESLEDRFAEIKFNEKK